MFKQVTCCSLIGGQSDLGWQIYRLISAQSNYLIKWLGALSFCQMFRLGFSKNLLMQRYCPVNHNRLENKLVLSRLFHVNPNNRTIFRRRNWTQYESPNGTECSGCSDFAERLVNLGTYIQNSGILFRKIPVPFDYTPRISRGFGWKNTLRNKCRWMYSRVIIIIFTIKGTRSILKSLRYE